MKVIHLISGLRGGGAERLVFELCQHALSDSPVEMEVVSLSDIDDIAWMFHQRGIKLLMPAQLGNSKKLSCPFINNLKNALFAMRYVKKSNADIIHAHMFHAGIAASLAKLSCRRSKIIFSLHNNYQSGILSRLCLFLTRPLRDLDLVFKGSKRRWYQKKKVNEIINGIDLKHFQNAKAITSNSKFHLLFVGRLERQKNPLFLIELAKQIRNRLPLKISIVGEGRLKEKLSESIQRENLSDIVELLGFRSDVSAIMKSSNCLIMPSLWEGMPLVLLEAGAAGLPILATPNSNDTGILNATNAYVADLKHLTSILIHIKTNYENALIKANNFRIEVESKYTIKSAYEMHLMCWRNAIKS